MKIDLIVKYQCGCTETVRTDANLPANLAYAERTTETDRRIIDYITANYAVENWHCSKKHPLGWMTGFDKIVEIL